MGEARVPELLVCSKEELYLRRVCESRPFLIRGLAVNESGAVEEMRDRYVEATGIASFPICVTLILPHHTYFCGKYHLIEDVAPEIRKYHGPFIQLHIGPAQVN